MEDDKRKKNREYMRNRRANETPEEREKRLEKARNYMRQRRDNSLHKKLMETDPSYKEKFNKLKQLEVLIVKEE